MQTLQNISFLTHVLQSCMNAQHRHPKVLLLPPLSFSLSWQSDVFLSQDLRLQLGFNFLQELAKGI
jgi:hypothetical protein